MRTPSARQLERAYPRRALERGESGEVLIGCLVRTDGHLHACHVLSESPSGRGFGAAARAVVDAFQMAPPDDGSPMAGRRVEIPIHFRLAD